MLSMSFPLYKGITSAFFILSGKEPSISEQLNMWQRGKVILVLSDFNIVLLILSNLWLILLGSHLIRLSISCIVVGRNTILLRFCGILLKYVDIGVVPGSILLAKSDPKVE